MVADGRRARPWALTAIVTAAGGALGLVYFRLVGGSTVASAALTIITAIAIFWVGLVDRGEHRLAKRIATFLVGATSLIGAFSQLTKIQVPSAVSSIAMIVALIGVMLGIWAYWADRKGIAVP